MMNSTFQCISLYRLDIIDFNRNNKFEPRLIFPIYIIYIGIFNYGSNFAEQAVGEA